MAVLPAWYGRRRTGLPSERHVRRAHARHRTVPALNHLIEPASWQSHDIRCGIFNHGKVPCLACRWQRARTSRQQQAAARRISVRKSIISLVAAGLIAGLAPAMAQGVPDGDVPTELVLGMVPSREGGQLVDSLDRIADYLSAELLIPVKTFVSTNYVGLIEAMGTGRVDIGMFGPSSLVQAVDLYGAEIILGTVRFGETSYYAQFSVRNDSGITEFSDLVGRTIAFVDPGSSSGYQFPYVFLKSEHGID